MVYYFTRSLLFGLLVSWHFEDAFCFSPREMKEKKRKDKRNKEKSCSDQKSCRNLLVEFVDNHREIECSDKEAKKCPILCGVCTPPTTLPVRFLSITRKLLKFLINAILQTYLDSCPYLSRPPE